MSQTVTVPGVGDLEFPDGMSQEQMAAAIQKNFPQLHRPPDSKMEEIGKNIARQLGLTARYAVEGITALPNMIGDALGLKSSEAVSGGLTKLGLPQPQGSQERVVGDVTRGMAGAVPFVAGGNIVAQSARPVLSRIASFMSEAPATQVLAGGGAGAASGTAREMGAGPVGQTVAGLAGGLAAPLGAAGGAAAVRGAVRGGEASRAAGEARIGQFEDSGVTPSAAQAFQTHQAQGTEAFLSRDPGSHGFMDDFAKRQAVDMGNKVDDVAGILAGKTSPMVAGRAIEEGITGPGGFLDKFKATSKVLYDRLDSFVPPESPAKVTNTLETLDRLTKPTAGAEQTSKLLVNPKILQIGQALKTDLKGLGTVQFSALKELRSRVGSMLSDSELISDAPRRQLKQLYAGLSSDMKNAVDTTGNKGAINAFNRANAYTRAGHQRIDDLLQPIINKTSPEKMFQAALSGSKEGDTMIHGVMQSLPPAQQKILASTILKKLGQAPAGAQGGQGGDFMVSTYLKNWNNLSPEAKRSLFSRWGPKFVQNLDTIAKTADDIQKGGRAYANPSGTGVALTLQHTVGGAVLLAIAGQIKLAAAVAIESTTSNATARLMTNPRFVAWLARSTRMPVEALPIALNSLSQEAKKYNDSDLMNFAQTLQDKYAAQQGKVVKDPDLIGVRG